MNAAKPDAPGLRPVPDVPDVPDVTASSSEAEQLAELMSRAARGQDEAFAELYDRTSSRVYGLVLRVVRSPDHAAEVTQEVFVEVWQQSARFDAKRGSVLAWMITMAHRRAVDRVRAVTRSTNRDQTWASHSHEQVRDEAWEAVENRLDVERVRKGLRSLTEIQREALSLAYFGGYTHTQVAQLLQLPLGTVKTRIRDGLIGLRDALGVEA